MDRLWMRIGVVLIALGSLHCDGDEPIPTRSDWEVADSGIDWQSTESDHAYSEGQSAGGQDNRPVRPDHGLSKTKVWPPMIKKIPDFRVVADGGTN